MDDTPETFPQAVLDALTDHLVVVAHTNITPRKRAEGKTAALMDALAAHLQSLIRLHEVSTRFVRNGDAPEFLGQVLETAMAVTGADFGTIQLLDPQSGTLAITAQRAFSAESLGLQLVWMLTEQLGGTIDLSRAEGTAVTLTFPFS
jgi:hypothetical protein